MSLTTTEPEAPKKPSIIVTAGAIAVLSLLGLGGGWFVGNALFVPAAPVEATPAPAAPEHAAEPAAAAGAEGEHGAPAAHGEKGPAGPSLIALDPIVTNLGYPNDKWIRLELALQFNGPGDVPLSQELHQELMSYLRTVSLQQIQGPRGFQYLRDDLREIVDVRSKGRVSKVLFRTFVIE
ncbi:flagellar basal body-associated FliL family protein [Rhizobium skierniewicense]|jgi:flagellar protein FliL|uniref:flagellar basal body-associated FliL family protein n=1 Tax=Rhizobium TaxID=379 RepID=UPI0017849FD4|nr:MULTISPECIES: flagellar basal body-associated FliL family protein [Rhizobium]MBD8685896.1 flagellar basal body-associated FliL family protein [Rhizobium sp. CFBP 13644]MBD8690431.1 flagellar basal body-associated FliL family protein [Rhizobium sp. CFBP 13717]MCI9866435.1 flagellar basal body-associated FliL family protein [Rhizobium skierniewicense]